MTTQIETINVRAEIRAAKQDADARTFKIRAIVYAGDIIKPAGWREGVVIDVAGVRVDGRVPLVADHSSGSGARLGECSIKVENGQILAYGEIVGGSEAADRIIGILKAGQSHSVSIGCDPEATEVLRAGESRIINERVIDGPTDIVTAGLIREISFVAVGQDSKAHAIAARYEKGNSMATVEASVQAERDRIRDIRAAFRGIDGSEAEIDRLIESGASAGEACGVALERTRASRPNVRASSDGGPDEAKVYTAALMTMAGRADLAASKLGSREAEEGTALVRRTGASVLAIGREMLRSRGLADPGSVDGTIRAAFSTDGLSGPMSTAISLLALDAFVTADESWRSFAFRAPLADFKENTLIRLAGAFQFQPVPKDGELKHSSIDGATSTIKLGTSGTILQLDRQAIINDGGVGLLAQIPTEMAREGARTIGDDLWDLITSNPGSFFSAGNGNYIEGANSALGIEGYGLAVAKEREQTDSSGRRLNIAPRWLIVPPALEAAGRRLLNSAEIIGTDGEGASNPWKGSAELLVEARITSDDEWYLFGDARNATAVVGTLNGADAPVVEEREPGPEVLGRVWRAYIDHGVALHETRGAVKSKGTT